MQDKIKVTGGDETASTRRQLLLMRCELFGRILASHASDGTLLDAYYATDGTARVEYRLANGHPASVSMDHLPGIISVQAAVDMREVSRFQVAPEDELDGRVEELFATHAPEAGLSSRKDRQRSLATSSGRAR